MSDEPMEGTRIPVRLKGGRRAYLEIPRPISQEDADEIKKFVDLQVEPDCGAATQIPSSQEGK